MKEIYRLIKSILSFGVLLLCLPVFAQINLQNGLVAYYPFNGNANDESGNGNNGTSVGVNLISDEKGIPNSAYHFDGKAYIKAPVSIKDDFSVSFLINSTLTGNISNISSLPTGTPWPLWYGGYSILDGSTIGIVNDWGIDLYDGKIAYGFGGYYSSTNYDQTILSEKPVNDGKWHNVVVTRSKATGKIQIYIDGILDSQAYIQNFNSLSDPSFLGIGVDPDRLNRSLALNNWYVGNLDEFRLYNRILNDAEIQSLYCNTYFITTPIITLIGGNTLAVTTLAGAGYQWYYNNLSVSGATNAVFNGTINAGNYSVTLTNGACSATTNVFTVTSPIINTINGLVAYYPFDGNANDESGNGNNPISILGASFSPDRLNNITSSISFNGVYFGSGIIVQSQNDLNFGSGSFSLSFWINSTKTATTLIRKGFSGAEPGYSVQIRNDGLLGFGLGSSTSSNSNDYSTSVGLYSQNVVNDGEWHLININVNRSTNIIQLYIDTILSNILMSPGSGGSIVNNTDYDISSLTTLSATTSKPQTIGTLYDLGYGGNGFVENLSGNIDDIRIYNRVINNAEIQSLYTTSSCDIYFANTPIITLSGSNLAVTSIFGANYQWYYNNVSVSGATNPVFNGTINVGSYKVQITKDVCFKTTDIYTVTGSMLSGYGLIFFSVKLATSELVSIKRSGEVISLGTINIPNLPQYICLDNDINDNLWLSTNEVLYKLDKNTGNVLELHSIPGQNIGPAISFSTDNQLYILNEVGGSSEGTLAKVDMVTYTSTPVSSHTSGLPSLLGIEFDYSNNLWTIDECCANQLHLLSTLTGTSYYTAPGTTNVSLPGDLDFTAGTLVGINVINNVTSLYKVDVTSGTTSQLFTLSGVYIGIAGSDNLLCSIPSKPIISRIGDNLSVANVAVGINYQWQFNGMDESGQISALHTIPLQNGIYQIKASPVGECASAFDTIQISLIQDVITITTIEVITVSGCDATSTVDPLNKQLIIVHPNPSTGLIYLQSAIEIGKVEVFNSVGKIIYSIDNQNVIDLSAQPKGMYVLKIHDQYGGYIHMERIIVE